MDGSGRAGPGKLGAERLVQGIETTADVQNVIHREIYEPNGIAGRYPSADPRCPAPRDDLIGSARQAKTPAFVTGSVW